MYLTALVYLLACGSPPQLSSVDPTEVLAGADVKLLGSDFPEDATVWLVHEQIEVQITDAAVRGPVLIEGSVPDGMAAGTWTVEVRSPSGTTALPDALTVTVVEEEVPCGGKWKANTQVSLARELVVIDRFAEGGEERETLRIKIGDIEQLEYEQVKLEDGDPPKLCGSIYVRKKDGTRVVFDDDTRLNLEPRTYKLAQVMKKPAKTTRKDVEDDPRPVEEN